MRLAALFSAALLCQAQSPTWRDVAPLFDRWCNQCHRAGQVGPFDFTTYEGASAYAPEILRELNAAKMPPWPVKPGPITFANSRRLPDEVTAKILTWISEGAKPGTPASTEARNPQWNLGTPDLIVSQPKEHTVSAEKTVEILRFEISPAALGTQTEDRYVRAIELRPSNRNLLHHAILIDGKSPIAAWALCDTGLRLPTGVAWKLSRNKALTVELHYFKRTLRPARDLTRVAFFFAAAKPTRIASLIELTTPELRIPAGANLHMERTIYQVPEDIRLHSILPVFQLLAADIRMRINGNRDYALWVEPFEHHLMSSYILAQPLALAKGTRIEAEAFYDNSTQNPFNPHKQLREVHFDENGLDETFRFWLTVSRPNR